MDRCKCINLKPVYKSRCGWPSILYLFNPVSGPVRCLCEVSGIGLPGSLVTLRIDGTRIETIKVEDDGTWTFPRDLLPILSKGNHQIQIKHSDGIGPDEYAYANINITEDYADDDDASRNTCCDNYGPSQQIKSFKFDEAKMPIPSGLKDGQECFVDGDLVLDSFGKGKFDRLYGFYTNPNRSLRHTLNLWLYDRQNPSIILAQGTRVIITAKSQTIIAKPSKYGSWYQDTNPVKPILGIDATGLTATIRQVFLDAWTAAGRPSGQFKKYYAIRAWDEDSKEFAEFKFCVWHDFPEI